MAMIRAPVADPGFGDGACVGGDFLRLSVALTGFGAEELAATGMADSYRTTVLQQIGGGNLGLLLAGLAEADGDPAGLADPALLEAARAVCGLWSLGVWPGLSAEACRALGLTGGQLPVRPSAEAYAQGLIWQAMGSHAPGTGGPGFGSWADPPPRPGRRAAAQGAPA